MLFVHTHTHNLMHMKKAKYIKTWSHELGIHFVVKLMKIAYTCENTVKPVIKGFGGKYWGVATPEGLSLVKNNRLA